jgi:hypothetical protein
MYRSHPLLVSLAATRSEMNQPAAQYDPNVAILSFAHARTSLHRQPARDQRQIEHPESLSTLLRLLVLEGGQWAAETTARLGEVLVVGAWTPVTRTSPFIGVVEPRALARPAHGRADLAQLVRPDEQFSRHGRVGGSGSLDLSESILGIGVCFCDSPRNDSTDLLQTNSRHPAATAGS